MRLISQWNGLERQEIDPIGFITKLALQKSGGKDGSSLSDAGSVGHPYGKTNKLDPCIKPYKISIPDQLLVQK